MTIFDQAGPEQASKFARHDRWRQAQSGHEIGSARTVDVELASCKVHNNSLSAALKKFNPITDGSAPTRGWIRRCRSRSPALGSFRLVRNAR